MKLPYKIIAISFSIVLPKIILPAVLIRWPRFIRWENRPGLQKFFHLKLSAPEGTTTKR